jgi:predicted nucleic acid-binding protein
MIVADASIFVEVILRPHQHPLLVQQVLDFPVFHAPAHIALEVLNAVRKPVLRKEISSEEASAALGFYDMLDIEKHVLDRTEIEEVWQLRNEITPYDAAYVVLARSLGLPLMTSDKRLANAAAKLVTIHQIL